MNLGRIGARTWGSRALVGAVIAATAAVSSVVTVATTDDQAFALVSPQPTPVKASGAPVTIANGATWAWRYSSQALPDDWNTVGFDASDWASGAAGLGRDAAGETTDIDLTSLSAKPMSAQFRKTFTVVGADTVHDGTVTVIADDGVEVFLNGVELGRANLPEGPIAQDTAATAAPRATPAAANRFRFTVPAKLLVEGENVIAASVHANYRATPDLSFDLALTMPR